MVTNRLGKKVLKKRSLRQQRLSEQARYFLWACRQYQQRSRRKYLLNNM